MFRINMEKTWHLWCGVFLSLGHTRVAPRGTSSWKGIRWMNTLTVLVAFLVVYISKQAGLSSWLKINTCWIQIAEFTGYSFLLRCLAYRPFKNCIYIISIESLMVNWKDIQHKEIPRQSIIRDSKTLSVSKFKAAHCKPISNRMKFFPGPSSSKIESIAPCVFWLSPHVCRLPAPA